MFATPAPKTFTPAEFAAFGLEQVAYLRPVQTPEGNAIGVFADNYRRFAAEQPLRYVVDFERGY